MHYTTLGESGLKVSPISLGAMNFGDSAYFACCDRTEAGRIIDRFLAAGHNLIDTADAYTGGESEQIIGAALRGRRDRVVVSTKAFLPQGDGPNQRGLSRAHLTHALEASLRRLDTDYIDIYYCHQWDPDTPIEETMATLDGFVRSGKVRYLGCSNFTAAQIIESQWAAHRVAGAAFTALQAQYSLVARTIEAEILPTCRRHGVGVTAWSPLGSGVLTGRYRGTGVDGASRLGRLLASPAPMAQRWACDLLSDRNLAIAAEVAGVAAELNTTAVAVALAWVAGRPEITSTLIGPRTIEQLDENLAGIQLPPEIAERLDVLSAPTNEPVNGMFTGAA
ncbi:aldo/keto reductase [Nocardia bovistercoris]|uniref:Aldo/keto reductase n=1 Tax=Nocardia bovistercoris TaxID=2785916 RepID=A0A931I833_9NOCA|nr:aldo/keto reductase [Nocardia bovistercoris]MBH0776652.1 aldo/keto reductase [Nocardia bovistercoris]